MNQEPDNLAPAEATEKKRIYGIECMLGGIAYLYNNIFYTLTATSYPPFGSDVMFDYNSFYELHVTGELSDSHGQYGDPGFVNIGATRIGLDALAGLKLRTGSQALASGTNTGYGIDGLTNLGGQDF